MLCAVLYTEIYQSAKSVNQVHVQLLLLFHISDDGVYCCFAVTPAACHTLNYYYYYF